jgi:uncharacterized membrane protein YvbJ
MKTCSKCGTEGTSKFCAKCGTELNNGAAAKKSVKLASDKPRLLLILWASAAAAALLVAGLGIWQGSNLSIATDQVSTKESALAIAQTDLQTATTNFNDAESEADDCYINWFCSADTYALDLAIKNSFESLMNDAQVAVASEGVALADANEAVDAGRSALLLVLIPGGVVVLVLVGFATFLTVKRRRSPGLGN